MPFKGVFRLAETVSAASFANPDSAHKLEKRLVDRKRKDRIPSSKSREASKDGSLNIQAPAEANPSTTGSSALRFKIVKPLNKIRAAAALERKGSSGSLKERAIWGKVGSRGGSSRSSPRPSSKVDSPQSLGGSPLVNRVRFVDAVIDDLEDKKTSKFEGKRGKAQHPSARRKGAPKDTPDGDVEMAALDRRFADLLGSYLIENDLEPPSDLYDSVDQLNQQDVSSSEDVDSEDEYVYDIYFREKETMWGSGPAGAADAGLRPAEVAGHEDLSSTALEAGPIVAAEPMATLVGFTEEDEIISEMENATKKMAQEIPNDSSDEFDEGEDEDSNDEGFYRNDYPEDEDAEDDEEIEQAGWGWSGPRKRKEGSDSDEDASEEDSEGY